MSDGEAVGGLQVIHIVIQMEWLLTHVLIGVVKLHSKSERTVLLHRWAHEEPTFKNGAEM